MFSKTQNRKVSLIKSLCIVTPCFILFDFFDKFAADLQEITPRAQIFWGGIYTGIYIFFKKLCVLKKALWIKIYEVC